MNYKINGNVISALFKDGENPLKNLKKIAGEFNSNLVIISAVGMIRNPKIGYFNGKKYEEKIFKGDFELLDYSGNVTNSNKGFLPHVHILIGDSSHQVYGGHLINGSVHLMNEIVLIKINDKFKKVKDKETGLQLWDL